MEQPSVERRRRHEDPRLEDHRQERTDWRVAPQWVLVACLTSAILFGSATGTALFHLVMQREAELKLNYSAPNALVLNEVMRRLDKLEVKAESLDERLPKYNEINHRLVEIAVTVEGLKKARRTGGS